jgi:hypothetical protein
MFLETDLRRHLYVSCHLHVGRQFRHVVSYKSRRQAYVVFRLPSESVNSTALNMPAIK